MNVCECTVKMVSHDSPLRATRGRNKKKGGLEIIDGKQKGSYQRLMPGLYLEDKIKIDRQIEDGSR